MTRLSKVVWQEGMHLAQHHFQAQARHLEASVDFALTRLFYAAYGVTALALDAEALGNGVVALRQARGVMPDGLAFDMPDGDPLPPSRAAADALAPRADASLLLLAIPPYRADGANVADGDEPDGARFTAVPRDVPDDVLGRDVRPVLLGRKNFRLLFAHELAREAADTDLVTLPIARVRRGTGGALAYDADYVPPSLQIGASPRLLAGLRRTVEVLDAKRLALLGERPASMAAAFGTHEITTYWLLHAVHSALPPLRHLLAARELHPERLYVELARLAGALCTFALDADPAQLPAYDHEHLGECVDALERHVRAHLELVVPTTCVRVPLRAAAEYLREGALADARTLGPSRWILGVRARLGEAEVAERVPRLLKVCSAEGVAKLVQRALPGMGLTYLPVPPAAIAPRVDTRYFAVNTDGPCWEHVRMTRAVGVFVPAELPGAELELAVLLDS
ncbi:type VI secretion protein [Gemmatimonadetes bacterium T265]|nr:type VI secretion protein [Gemmatimonadetes bacterium T265]